MLAHNDGYGLLSMVYMFNFCLLLPHCCDNISQISNIAQCCLWAMSLAQPGASWLEVNNFVSLGNSSQCRGHGTPLQQGCLLLAKPCEKSSPECGCASPALLWHVIYTTIDPVIFKVFSCLIASSQEGLPSHMPKYGSEIEIIENSETSGETELAVTTGLSHSSVQEDDGHDNHVCSTVIYSNLDTFPVAKKALRFPCRHWFSEVEWKQGGHKGHTRERIFSWLPKTRVLMIH